MEDSKIVETHMSTTHNLSKNDDSNEVNYTTYRSMIWKLHYVVHTGPNIALVVGKVNPKENHMMVLKIILDT